MDFADRVKQAANQAQELFNELGQELKQQYEQSDLDEKIEQLKESVSEQLTGLTDELKRNVDMGVAFVKESHEQATKAAAEKLREENKQQ